MTMHRMVNGVEVEISPEEEILIIAEWNENELRMSKDAWADQRRLAYGSYGEQLDMIYHDAIDGTQVWKDHISAVKVQFPKPEEN